MKHAKIIFFLLSVACGTLSLPVGAVGSSASMDSSVGAESRTTTTTTVLPSNVQTFRQNLAHRPQQEEEEDQLLEIIEKNGPLVEPLLVLAQRGGDVAVHAAGALFGLASIGLLDATHVVPLLVLAQRDGDVGVHAAGALSTAAVRRLLGATHVGPLLELAERDGDVGAFVVAALDSLASRGLLGATHVGSLFELAQRDGDVGTVFSSVIANYFQRSHDTDEVRGCMNSHFSSLVEGAKKGNVSFAQNIVYLANQGLIENSHYQELRELASVGGEIGKKAIEAISAAKGMGCDFRSFYQKKRYLLPALASLIAAHRIYTHRDLLRTKSPEKRRAQLAKMWILDRLLMRGASWAHDNVLPQRWRLAQD